MEVDITPEEGIAEGFEGFQNDEKINISSYLEKLSKDLDLLAIKGLSSSFGGFQQKKPILRDENMGGGLQETKESEGNDQKFPEIAKIKINLNKRRSLDLGIRSKKSRSSLIGKQIQRRKSELDSRLVKDKTFGLKEPPKKSWNGNGRSRPNQAGANIVSGELAPVNERGNQHQQHADAIIHCSISCPKAMGLIPTLQCSQCLCLFHNECAAVDATKLGLITNNFTCQNCYTKSRSSDVSRSAMTNVSNIQTNGSSVAQKNANANNKNIPTRQPEQLASATDTVPQYVVTINHRRFIVVPNRGEKENLPTIESVLPVSQRYPNWLDMGSDDTLNWIMSHVFEFLTIQELLRASRVCKVWNKLAQESTLWQSVSMKNSRVTDWNDFGKTLCKHGTKRLDLRKMLNSSEPNWNNFYSHLAKVETLRELCLDVCDVLSLQKIFSECPYLEVLHVQKAIPSSTTDNRLYLNLFSTSHRLKVLHIRAQNLTMASINLTPLENNLESLSLLNFENLKQYTGLGVHKNLEVLQLGSCASFTNDFSSSILPFLINLKSLRLENCIENCPVNDILEAVSALSNLRILELINFKVESGFNEVLVKCKQIERLMLVPSCLVQSSTGMNLLLKGVFNLSSSLKQLVCAVTVELLEMTEFYVEKNEKGQNSIPVSAPLPSTSEIDSKELWGAEKSEKITGIVTVSFDEFRNALSKALPFTKTSLVKVYMTNTYTLSIHAY